MKVIGLMAICSFMLLTLITASGCGPGMEMGTIVFTSTRDGNPEIYSMRADGKKQKRLTRNSVEDEDPCWSPDMSRIAYSSRQNGNWDIFVMNSDGSDNLQLTTTAMDDRFPCWSPDGKKIAFCSNRSGSYELYLMNPDGKEQHPIKIGKVPGQNPVKPGQSSKSKKQHSPGEGRKHGKGRGHGEGSPAPWTGVDCTRPAWYPDGSAVLFMRENKAGSTLWRVSPDGKKIEQITRSRKRDIDPSVSPDGSRILFSSNENDAFQIYMIQKEPSSRTLMNMADLGPENTGPRWSPEGKNFVFVSTSPGKREIFRKRILSGDDIASLQKKKDREIRLTGKKGENYAPCWGRERQKN